MDGEFFYVQKKRHPKVPSSDLNHFNFNNMYWTPIQILFYHVNLFCILIKKKKPHTLEHLFYNKCTFAF
ncbi:hypothetical protein COA06_00940 [Bacillus thuringiensis]|nr:hypothetical protein COA06_00940 [Bacillus thuringiensis]